MNPMIVPLIMWIGALIAAASACWLFAKFRYKGTTWIIDPICISGLLILGTVRTIHDGEPRHLAIMLYFTLVFEILVNLPLASADSYAQWFQEKFDSDPAVARTFRRRLPLYKRLGFYVHDKEADTQIHDKAEQEPTDHGNS